MKIIVFVGLTSIAGSSQETEFEIDDSELDDLSDEEKDELFQGYVDVEVANHLDCGWYIKDE